MTHRTQKFWRATQTILGGLIVLLWGTTPGHAQRSSARQTAKLQVHQKRQNALEQEFAQKLEVIAAGREALGRKQDVLGIREISRNAVFNVRRIQLLPRQMQKEISRQLPANERTWRVQLLKAQQDYANQLYILSRRALRDGLVSYSYQLVRESARHYPDHSAARRLLGYVRNGSEWVTPFEKYKIDKREVWHDKFGWLPKAHVEKYNQGLRYYQPIRTRRGQWITADRAKTNHSDFRNPWIIRTEHYLIKTNHSLERGVEIAKKMEEYYQYFFQTFAGFFTSREQMQKLFSGSSRKSWRETRPYTVHYYKNKAEYVRALIATIPQIEITNGLYLTVPRTAYFFHNPNVTTDHTLYHEATHQIFYESLKSDRLIAHQAHFWIIEGIACYMESFQRKGASISLGDPTYARFVAAKYRYVTSRYYVPLQQFAALGMRNFQNDPNIKKNYSQAAGLSKFFMDYDDGRYRDALIEHLSQLYRAKSRRSRVQSLSALAGVSNKELDKQYGEYIQSLKTRKTEYRFPQP
jgi:hypothetical protein